MRMLSAERRVPVEIHRKFPRRCETLPLPEPTGVPPGPWRVAVLAMRVRYSQQLFHPLDAKVMPEGLGAFVPKTDDRARGLPARLPSARSGGGRTADSADRSILFVGEGAKCMADEMDAAESASRDAELRDAIGRVERIFEKAFRQAAGLGCQTADKMRDRTLSWWHGQAAKLLAK